MRRFAIVAMQGTGVAGDPFTPNVAGDDWVMVGPQVGNRCLVKSLVADGTATTGSTVADLLDGDADVQAITLTAGQKSAIKTFLQNNGISGAQFDADGVSDRRQFLRFLLRRWKNWAASDFALAITGYDCDG